MPGGDVDAVAIEVVALDDYVAEVMPMRNSIAAVPTRHSCSARALHAAPQPRSAPHRRRWQIPQQAVAGGLDNAAVMLGDFRIDELAAQCFEAFERALLVR